ncbi:Fic family protein [Leptospira dzoumogneensis]|uniref:Fic family protein n=1 Tax=Leptospira dzoumogneensis TaxID=2484904 RepID=A0A4Z1AFJ0_9LEPT|nr:Fic family protein [Leptospira dzoumogneensis]TGN02878.1 Fic family protein [Leptospira dzoumogneensis]
MVSFHPEIPYDLPELPPALDLEAPNFLKLIAKARTELGELKGFASALPNPMLLLSPAIIKESVASSNIENINTTVSHVLQQSLFPEYERNDYDKEVLRYRNAVELGFYELRRFPISYRLIEKVHKELMSGKESGFRKLQNKIVNSNTGEPIYTPPIASKIPELLSNLERFLNEDKDGIDPLLKCAISHYQFEAIHPFLDGNGRTGRILMVLYLIQTKILSLPILYISGYINNNRSKYYELLSDVSRNGNWEQFLEFMLNAFYLQARSTKNLLFKIIELYQTYKTEISADRPKLAKSGIVEAMFSSPVLSPVSLAERINVHYTTATRYLAELKDAKYLVDMNYGKYHLFINKVLLDLLQEDSFSDGSE